MTLGNFGIVGYRSKGVVSNYEPRRFGVRYTNNNFVFVDSLEYKFRVMLVGRAFGKPIVLGRDPNTMRRMHLRCDRNVSRERPMRRFELLLVR